MLGRLIALGAGALAGAYVVNRHQRNLATELRPLRDVTGRSLEPRFVELDGGECVPVVDVGEGPVIVLIPGLNGDSQVFRHQIPVLAEDYRIVAPNLRFDFDGVEENFDQFAQDVVTILDALEVRSATLLGLSFGGPICMRCAVLFPDRVDALILTNTLARLDLSHVGLNRTLLIPVARWTSRYLPVPMMRRISEMWGKWGVWVYDPSPGNDRIIDYELEVPVRIPLSAGGIRLDTFKDCDLRPDLPGTDQPALIVAGASDNYTPNAWQREIADLLPNATYVEIAYGGHLSLISHAETFNQVVLDWLATEVAGSGRQAHVETARGPEN